jgi:hypothetical protein
VETLRRFFGAVFVTLDLLSAVAAMNAVMGIDGEGSLPAQVDNLVALVTGSPALPAAPAAAPAPAPAAAPAPSAGKTSSKAAGKRRQREPPEGAASSSEVGTPPPPKSGGDRKLTDMFSKFLIRKTDLETVAKRQHVGMAVPYEPLYILGRAQLDHPGVG